MALSGDGGTAIIAAPSNDGTASNAGHVRVWDYDSGVGHWEHIGDDIDGEAGSDKSGYAVSVSSDGTVVAVGAIKNDGNGDNAGHVRVYALSSGSWSQQVEFDGEVAGDRFGYSVSLSAAGTRLIVGAPKNGGNGDLSGHARIFDDNGDTTWSVVGADIDGSAAGDKAGSSVAVSGDGSVVCVGAPQHSSAKGNVRCYEFEDNLWSLLGSPIVGADNGEESGTSIALSTGGSTPIVCVGAPKHASNKGTVRVFRYESWADPLPAWVQLSSDVDGSANDLFGSVVSIAAGGGSFVAGGPGNDLTRVYESLPSWQQQGDDLEGAEGSGFGSAVSMAGDGDTVVVGAPEAGNGGRAYIYAWASNAWTALAVDE